MQVRATPDARRLLERLTDAGRAMVQAGFLEMQAAPLITTLGVPWGATTFGRIPQGVNVGLSRRNTIFGSNTLYIDILVVAPTWEYANGSIRMDGVPKSVLSSMVGRSVGDLIEGELIADRTIEGLADGSNPCDPATEGAMRLTLTQPTYEGLDLRQPEYGKEAPAGSGEFGSHPTFTGRLADLTERLPEGLSSQIRAIALSHADAMTDERIPVQRRVSLQSVWLMPKWGLHHSPDAGMRLVPEVGVLRDDPTETFLTHYESMNPQRTAA